MISLFSKFIPNKPVFNTSPTSVNGQVTDDFEQEVSTDELPKYHPDYFYAYYYHPMWI